MSSTRPDVCDGWTYLLAATSHRSDLGFGGDDRCTGWRPHLAPQVHYDYSRKGNCAAHQRLRLRHFPQPHPRYPNGENGDEIEITGNASRRTMGQNIRPGNGLVRG